MNLQFVQISETGSSVRVEIAFVATKKKSGVGALLGREKDEQQSCLSL